MHGWLASKNLHIECLGEVLDMGDYVQYNNLLSKFPADQVFDIRSDYVCFLDGYVHNKSDFINDTDCNWQQAFSKAMAADLLQSLCKLRGGFCGYLYDRHSERLTAYVDQASVKALYYWSEGDKWMLSGCVEYMVEVLKYNHISYDFEPWAAKYMLTYGYMIDDSTFVKQIRRILPGKLVRIENGHAENNRYYLINNHEVHMTEQEAVEKIDAAFREAVRREFEKDREYGYRHLVDLSGGLDSRMVAWVAHDLGYTDQVNISYSRAGYHDENISKRIAGYLGHEYIFKTLDDAKWMKDIEHLTSQNNGAALYMGLTGGERLLQLLNFDQFGIEHTGMIGDAILSTFYHDRDFNYSKPRFGMHRYSERLQYDFDSAVLEEYPCQEIFAVYTRGILGAQSSYIIRQHYIETSSPFLDVDFLDTVFSIPFDYRKKHHIYLKWIASKYPEASDFGWEKWGGVKPRESLIFVRKLKTTQRLLLRFVCSVFHWNHRDLMIPLDYWYEKNSDIQKYMQAYYESEINNSLLDDSLRNDISVMFRDGDVNEKSMALTTLAMVKKYFS